MRVMVIVKATKEAEAQDSPLEMEGAAEILEAMGKYNEELVRAGIVLAGDGLKPSKFGKRIHFSGAKRTVTDGPFAETRSWWPGSGSGRCARWTRRSSGQSDARTRCRGRASWRSVPSGSPRISDRRSPRR